MELKIAKYDSKIPIIYLNLSTAFSTPPPRNVLFKLENSLKYYLPGYTQLVENIAVSNTPRFFYPTLNSKKTSQ